MTAPTLPEFKDHAKVEALSAGNRPSDTVLDSYLAAALEYVERRCGSLDDGDITVPVREANPRCPYLPLPLTRVDEVVSLVDPDGVTVDVDELETNLEAGLVYAQRPRRGTWTVTVRRSGAAASQQLHLAVLIIGKHLLDVRRSGNPPGGPMEQQYGVPEGFAVPRRATELMADWVVPGLA